MGFGEPKMPTAEELAANEAAKDDNISRTGEEIGEVKSQQNLETGGANQDPAELAKLEKYTKRAQAIEALELSGDLVVDVRAYLAASEVSLEGNQYQDAFRQGQENEQRIIRYLQEQRALSSSAPDFGAEYNAYNTTVVNFIEKLLKFYQV